MMDPERDMRAALVGVVKQMRGWLEAEEIPRAEVEELLFELVMLLDDLQ